jgi:hypothetical protein
MLFEHQEDIPKWSSAVNDCRVCIAGRIIDIFQRVLLDTSFVDIKSN